VRWLRVHWKTPYFANVARKNDLRLPLNRYIYVNVELSHNYIAVYIVYILYTCVCVCVCVYIILVCVDEFPFVENSCSETLHETVNALISSSSLQPQSHLIHYWFDTFSFYGPVMHLYNIYHYGHRHRRILSDGVENENRILILISFFHAIYDTPPERYIIIR